MDNMKRCVSCGYEAKQDAKFCLRCGGTQFHGPTVRCSVCGTDVPAGQYCAHCGADLQNPGAQVWLSCSNCGSPVHITYSHCSRCGAANLPPVQPKQLKKRNGVWLALLLIPVLLLFAGIGVLVDAYLNGELPELNFPGTTTSQQQPEQSTPAQPVIPSSTRPVTQPEPEITEPKTEPPTKPTEPPTVPTEPPTVPTELPTVPTEPPTQPTEPPTQPTEPPTQPPVNIPSLFKDNHYLSAMGDGYCETMTGDMLVIFLFVNDPTDGWTDAEMTEAENAMTDQLRRLLNEAGAYNVELNIQVSFTSVTIQSEYVRGEDGWKEEAMKQVGLSAGYNDQRTLESYYGVDQVPVVFVVDEPGRSYANSYYSGAGFESLVILQKDYTALRHELCHLFGARDLYFPQETVTAAKTYLPNSIMRDSSGDVDPLTAFVIGWTDQLSDAAVSFLWATNDLTEEDIAAAKEQDQLTGYGTKYYDNGHYTGYMVGGVAHGQGSYYWNDGMVYTGEWVNGLRSGYGEIKDNNGFSYKGYWLDDYHHGTGSICYEDGATYTGDFVRGERHGQGTYHWPDGDSYVGAWVNGKRTGYGTFYWADGTVYEGEWLNGYRNGYGEMQNNTTGFWYKGYWKDDLYHGSGSICYTDANTYTGDFVAGKRHGQGTYTWTNGTVYSGAWVEGTCHGEGTMTWTDGQSYTGDWKNGNRHGKGTYRWADGSYYIGDFVENQITGYGERYYASYGTRYEGDFVNGKRHGYGTYYYTDGTVYTGRWENDVRVD